MSAELEVQRIMQRNLLLALMVTAASLTAHSGPVAASMARDCWSCIADLELGCNCSEAAQTLVSSADKWLASAA